MSYFISYLWWYFLCLLSKHPRLSLNYDLIGVFISNFHKIPILLRLLVASSCMYYKCQLPAPSCLFFVMDFTIPPTETTDSLRFTISHYFLFNLLWKMKNLFFRTFQLCFQVFFNELLDFSLNLEIKELLRSDWLH